MSDYLTVRQAAERLGISGTSMRTIIDDGKIEIYTYAGIRIKASDLDDFTKRFKECRGQSKKAQTSSSSESVESQTGISHSQNIAALNTYRQERKIRKQLNKNSNDTSH